MSRKNKQKRFDCLAFKDQVQLEMYEATKHMSRDEFTKYLHDRVAEGPFADLWRRVMERQTQTHVVAEGDNHRCTGIGR